MKLTVAAAALCLLCQGTLGQSELSASNRRAVDLEISKTGRSLTATSLGRNLLTVACTAFASGITCDTGEDPYCCSCGYTGCGGVCTYCDYSQGCATCPAARPKAACCITYPDKNYDSSSDTPPPPPIVAAKKLTDLTCLYGDGITCYSPELASCCTSKDPQEAVCSTYFGDASGSCPSTQPFGACCKSAYQSPPPAAVPPTPPTVETEGFYNGTCVFGDALSCALPAEPSCCTANSTSNETYCSFYEGDSSGSCPVTQRFPACCAPSQAPTPSVTSSAPFPKRAMVPPSSVVPAVPVAAAVYAPAPAVEGLPQDAGSPQTSAVPSEP